MTRVAQNEEQWTTEALVDALFLRLCSVKEILRAGNDETLEVSKYKLQARKLARQIPVYRPTPEFVIYESDLTPKIVKELRSSCQESRRYVLTQAAGRIFENLDRENYHLSIARNLKVRIER